MTYYVNLANGAVTQGLYDGAHQPSGWVTKTEGDDGVQLCFHNNQVPALLPNGVAALLGIKALNQFAEGYLTSVTGFAAPQTAGQFSFYTASLLNNTVPINLALGSTDEGQTPGDVPSIPQTTCEIQWWLNGPNNPPRKSLTFSIEIDNTPNRGNEMDPGTTTPYPAPTAVDTIAARNTAIAAAIAGLGGGFTLNPVATNAAKLALTGIAAGYLVEITGEGNRIEQFLGGDITQDANWLVLRNTINLTVHNTSGADFTLNGITCGDANTTNVGWADPSAISHTIYDGCITNVSYGNNEIHIGHDSSDNEFFLNQPGTFALPDPTPLRQSDVFISVVGGG